jgi:peptidoglycan hydrolase-like protein with peptidoglycan-binding domain
MSAFTRALHSRSLRNRVTVLAAALTVSGAAAVGLATPASAAAGESLAGCPLLLEDKSSGRCVKTLQRELNVVNPAHNLIVTRVFDAPTRIAVLDFQGRNDLPADGNVGPITAAELQKQYDEKTAGNNGDSAGQFCPEGNFCAFADANYGGGRLLQSAAGRGSNRVDVANDQVSSTSNRTGNQWLGVNTRDNRPDEVVFRSAPHSNNSYVGNSANDKIDHFDVR